MKVRDMALTLANLDPEDEIMCLDGSNGGGCPREINLGPVGHVVTEAEARECSDCEGLTGHAVRVIGYGCY